MAAAGTYAGLGPFEIRNRIVEDTPLLIPAATPIETPPP